MSLYKLMNKSFFSCFSFLLLTTGCAVPDPRFSGATSFEAGIPWDGPPSPYEEYCEKDEARGELDFLNDPKEMEVFKLIDVALSHNPSTKRDWFNARAAAYEVGVAKSALYPTVIGSADISLTKNTIGGDVDGLLDPGLNAQNPATGQNADNVVTGEGGTGTAVTSLATTYTQTVDLELTATWLMLDFGGRNASIQAAKQALFAADWSYNRTIQTVINTVLTNYYNLMYNVEGFHSKQIDLKNSQTNLDAAQNQFHSGIVTKVDVLLAQSNLVNIQLQMEQFRGQIKISMGQLATSMGLNANTEIAVGKLPEVLPSHAVIDGLTILMEKAKSERPDLAASYANYFQNVEQITVAWSSGMPNLTSSVELLKTNFIHNSVLNGHLYNGAISLNIPLFAGFLYEYELRNAKSLADQAWASMKVQEEQVLLDVVTSYSNFTTAVQTVKFSEEFLKYTREAYELALATYTQGTGSILDLLTAQTSLSNARLQWIQSRTGWATSLANLAYATGSLNRDFSVEEVLSNIPSYHRYQ
jgi:outer membrane protein